MKGRIILVLLLLAFVGSQASQLHGQEKIADMVTAMEKAAQSPPAKNAVNMQADMESYEDGTVRRMRMRKFFTIKDSPNFVEQIMNAFALEKEKAKTISENLNNGIMYKRYVFQKGREETVCMLYGTKSKMDFSYSVNMYSGDVSMPDMGDLSFRFETMPDRGAFFDFDSVGVRESAFFKGKTFEKYSEELGAERISADLEKQIRRVSRRLSRLVKD